MPEERDEREVATPITVHAMLVLYDANEDAVKHWATTVEEALAPHGVKIVHRLPLDLRLDENGIGREHFGFADGLSQPMPYDEKSGDPSRPDSRLLSTMASPSSATIGTACRSARSCSVTPMRITRRRRDRWCRTTNRESARGGSAAGWRAGGIPKSRPRRQLHGGARTPAARRARSGNRSKTDAARIRAHDPSATHVTADWLAERVIGRNLDGHLLCPMGFLKPDPYRVSRKTPSDFARPIPMGVGCPLGSHVRRANPRDSLAKDLASAQTLLDAANNHRILRRGRKYGTTLADRNKDDGTERGLLFICLNTDIARQFEFVQQTWLLNKNFHTLFDETDPLVGPKGRFTIREEPLRRIVEVETFIQSAGGEYFFLPSIPALNYLAAL